MATALAETGVQPEDHAYAAAAAFECAGARQYRYLAAWWEAQGDRALTRLFDKLAALEQAHLNEVRARSPHGAVTLCQPDWVPPPLGDEAWRLALRAPYLALAYAVREEERACNFYAEVASRATTAPLRALAADLSQAERDHAAIVLEAQRAAFPTPPASIKPLADRQAARRQGGIWSQSGDNAARAGLARSAKLS
jgi:rubrerythrin